MPKRTIYIKDSDFPVWQQAAQVAGDNLAGFIARALHDYLAKDEFREMRAQIDLHGTVIKRILFVWGSRLEAGNTAWGTSFASRGTGPDQAQNLIARMKSDPEIRAVELEERRVYEDDWIDRRTLESWHREAAGWTRHAP